MANETGTMTVEVWQIDAWHNNDEGWWWNDRSKVSEFTIAQDTPDPLIEKTFLRKYDIRPSAVTVDWYSEHEAEIRDRKTDKPLIQLVLRNP